MNCWATFIFTIAAVILIIVIFLIILILERRDTKEEKTERLENPFAYLRVNMEGFERTPTTENSPAMSEKKTGIEMVSADEKYAAAHGMWICKRCETMNERRDEKCVVCNFGKNDAV